MDIYFVLDWRDKMMNVMRVWFGRNTMHLLKYASSSARLLLPWSRGTLS